MNDKELRMLLGIPGEKAFESVRKKQDANGYYKMVGKYHKTMQVVDAEMRKKGAGNE